MPPTASPPKRQQASLAAFGFSCSPVPRSPGARSPLARSPSARSPAAKNKAEIPRVSFSQTKFPASPAALSRSRKSSRSVVRKDYTEDPAEAILLDDNDKDEDASAAVQGKVVEPKTPPTKHALDDSSQDQDEKEDVSLDAVPIELVEVHLPVGEDGAPAVQARMYPVQTVVRKEFAVAPFWFRGVVAGYNCVNGVMQHDVVYDDGDQEDMTLAEVQMWRQEYAAHEAQQTPVKKKRKAGPVPVAVARKASSAKKPVAAARRSMQSSSDEDEQESDAEIVSHLDQKMPAKKRASKVNKAEKAPPPAARQSTRVSPVAKKKSYQESDSEAEVEEESESEDEIVDVESESDDESKVQESDEDNESESEDDSVAPSKKKPARANSAARKPNAITSKARPKSKRAPKEKSKDESATAYNRTALKTPYTGGEGLEIIAEPQAMFDDMIGTKLTNNGENSEVLIPLLKALKNRTIRVATMCSGTESPVLALDMLQKAIRKQCASHLADEMDEMGIDVDRVLQVDHVFSCEIEPFKQAYIERNFHPPLLFRDIRELGEDKAYTAYGGLVNVPNTLGCVDMLIAGTSCVDYSNLNNKKKKIDEGGESGQTFDGMLKWIQKAQPPIVILENVYGAPWDEKVKYFEAQGYAATFLRLDTKKYYVPHTRQRGYLFAVKRVVSKKNSINYDDKVQAWKGSVTGLERPASASLDDYMLSNGDPRVLRGRAKLTMESSSGDGKGERTGRTDWTKCETRHQKARTDEELGDMRPFTQWSESGNTTMPSYAWNEWMNAQVHRIHDLVDINTLRLAQVGVDATYKTMVWNLSQNVDRDTMGRLGLCQCLTPTGVPYVTNRGGPLVGEELLLLQGIPSDDLLLTKESEENLKDLAGNAMTTTVVGACMLSALLQGYTALTHRDDNAVGSKRVGEVARSLVPPPLLPVSDVEISQALGSYKDTQVDLGSASLDGSKAWSAFLREATSSAKKCTSEGSDEALPPAELVVCKECGQSSSKKNAVPPRKFEEHRFCVMDEDLARMKPLTFRTKLLRLVPMLIRIYDLDVETVSKPSGVDDALWGAWKEQVKKFVGSETPSEFRFTHVTRSRIWTAHYVSRQGGRMELRVLSTGITWLLFGNVPEDTGNETPDGLEEAFQRPVARMKVRAPNGDSIASLVNGTWELCLPTTSVVQLSIEKAGTEVKDSWRKRLGLEGEFESEYEFEDLKVTVESSDPRLADAKLAIDGTYRLLPKCGGACGSLRKKTDGDSEMFFFIESKQMTLPTEDAYVFATTCHRTSYGEYRDIVLGVDPKEVYRPIHSIPLECYKDSVRALVWGQWIPLPEAAIKTMDDLGRLLTVTQPTSMLTVPMSSEGWNTCPEIISCTVPVEPGHPIFKLCDRAASCVEVNLQKSKSVFLEMAFVLSRLSIPAVVDVAVRDEWLALDSRQMEATNGEFKVCAKCAPGKPKIRWTVVKKGNVKKCVPIEDGQEAAIYERALKKRPEPWIVRLRRPGCDETLVLQIGCNAVSLVQRAIGLLPADSLARRSVFMLDGANTNECTFGWRVVSHEEKTKGHFPKMLFTSNKNDAEASQPPGFRMELRKEQLRSLKWMLSQEATVDPFLEEEVIESILPSLNWRAEGRVLRPTLVRGGIIADEVGYGKTAITLGLIDSAEEVNGKPPSCPSEYAPGFVPTKATLVIVPSHLMSQWPKEIMKFLGNKQVCVINTMANFNKLTVEMVQKADIVVVNFQLLGAETYHTRLARFSGIDPASFSSGDKGGRHFDAVYYECLAALFGRVKKLKNDNCHNIYRDINSDATRNSQRKNDESVRMDSKHTVYKNGSAVMARKKITLKKSELDPWGMAKLNKFNGMKSPPLEMFFWNRIVVDEFTYLTGQKRARVSTVVTSLKSSYRWCLSGTPRHGSFNDIQQLSNLLGAHLGVNESLPGAKLTKARQKSVEMTGLESLSHFLEVRSMQWHERRHQLGQAFLDRFVRQNIAEIDEIPFEEHRVKVELPPAERAIYLELETYLESLEMNATNAQRSKKKSTGDRASRMQKSLQDSASAEEALLKCCSHFNLSSDSATALETIADIIKHRKKDRKDCERNIVDALIDAYRQRQRVLDVQPDWSSLTGNILEKGEVKDELKLYEKEVEKKKSVHQGADDEVHECIKILLTEAQRAFDDAEKSPKKRKREDLPDIRDRKVKLRDDLHIVRSVSKELCGRIRSLRYIEWIRRFQTNEGGLQCSKCEVGGLPIDKFGVLSACGHAGCLFCLKAAAKDGKCVCEDCSANINKAHVISSGALGLENEDASTGRYGKKLTEVVNKVQDIISQGDRLIVFCQFDSLKDKVHEALTASNVLAMQVKGNVHKQLRALEVFQKEKPDKKDAKVLLLKMDDEQSAGLNLTNLNHAIFVHPLLASDAEYEAYETQAIGRIRRFGQSKTVHVWRFLANDTIDTRLDEERSHRTMAE